MSDMLELAAAIDRLAAVAGGAVRITNEHSTVTAPRRRSSEPVAQEGWLKMRMTEVEARVLDRVNAHPMEDNGQDAIAHAIDRGEGEVSRALRLLERAGLIESAPAGIRGQRGLRYKPKEEKS